MDINTGRPDCFDDVLMGLHTGQWYDWTDGRNKIYENLIVCKYEDQSPANQANWGRWDDLEDSKPTEEFLESELLKMQQEWDAQEYARKRQAEYPAIGDQLDEIYHNGIDSWKAIIKVTKDKYPKG